MKLVPKIKCLPRKFICSAKEVHYYMVYIAYFTELNLQICNYAQKQRICRENCKYALDESFLGHICPRRKAAKFCHPAVEVPSSNENGRLPVLDLELEVVNGRIEHGYYEKPCASEVVIPLAHSRKMKMSIMVEEDVRRLRNAARGLDWERSRAVMEKWSRKLRRSGYPATLRHEMIGASIATVGAKSIKMP